MSAKITNSGNITKFGSTLETTEEGKVISLSELGEGLRFGNAELTSSHLRAGILTAKVEFGQAKVGATRTPKSWVVPESVFQREFTTDTKDISAFLRVFFVSQANLSAQINPLGGIQTETKDLSTSLFPFHTYDITASLASIPPEDIAASVEPIPSVDLPTSTLAIASVDLKVFAGGHFPEDITGSLSVTQPRNLPAFLRSAEAGQDDLTASIVQQGGFKDLQVLTKALSQGSGDLNASLISRVPVDLVATISGWVEEDISAYVRGWHSSRIISLIKGIVEEEEKNLPASLRVTNTGTKDLKVESTRAIVSTHTNSNKTFNLDKVIKPFFKNKYLVGTRKGGFSVLSLEPVFGDFPDLSASIFAQDFFRKNLRAFLRVNERKDYSIGASVTSVSPAVNMDSITLSLTPLRDLTADIFTRSGFKRLRGLVKPIHKASTGTAVGAGYVTVANSYKFLIGTSKGLFIPKVKAPTVRTTTFTNSHPMPDLHADVSGWHVANLTASIKDYPFSTLTSTLTAISSDRFSDLITKLFPTRFTDLSAGVTPSGGFMDLQTDLSVSGSIGDLSVSVFPYINAESVDVLSISTKPFVDFRASINYGTLVDCLPESGSSDIGAFVRVFNGQTEETKFDLPTELNVLTVVSDLTADLTVRKRTRINTVGINFRARARSNNRIRSLITGIAPSTADLSSSIKGVLHEKDLAASLTAVRPAPAQTVVENLETVVDLKNPSDIKNIILTFKSGVSRYVYEAATNSVFATDRDTWVVNLKTLLEEDSFFDRSVENETRELGDLQEFTTVDEAIRNAIVLLTERNKSDLQASLVPSGGARDISATLQTTSADRILDMKTSIVSVLNSPDISASINTGPGSSGYLPITSIVKAVNSQVSENIKASVSGVIQIDLSVDITAA